MYETAQKLELAKKLYDVGVIQFGTFTLKSGIISPIYADVRRIISYPDLLQMVIEQLAYKVHELSYDVMCGVPYAALPLATGIALKEHKPMIMVRKEAKNHGTKKLVEGAHYENQTVLLVEDVVSTGASIIEAVQKIRTVGLRVTDALVVIDREQGSCAQLKHNNIQLHALYTLSEITDALFAQGIIDATTITQVGTFLKQNHCQT